MPASSGKITRHRLSRGGDRGANNALHHIAVVRMSSHPPTRAYVTRHRAAGRPTPEILRMLKRAIAREMFKYLTRRITVPAIDDLRATRQAKNVTLTQAAAHFGRWPTALSRIETEPNETTPSPTHTQPGSTRLDTNRSVSPSSTHPTSRRPHLRRDHPRVGAE